MAMPSRAFTVVELLVVMAIITILAAIFLPVLSQARRAAWGVACASNQKQLGLAAAKYASDWNGFIPVGHQRWRYLLLPELYPNPTPNIRPGTVYDCPASIHRVYLSRTTGGGGILQNDDGNTGSMGVIWMQNAYQYKGPCVSGNDGTCNKNGDNWYWPLGDNRAWRKMSESVYITDAVRSLTALVHPTVEGKENVESKGTNHIAVDIAGDPAPIAKPGYTGAYPPGGVRRFANRHNGSNCLFADGHVRLWDTIQLEAMKPRTAGCIWDAQ